MHLPLVPFSHLDELWFQVTGTLCNLQCRHCFISSSPHNHAFGFLSVETIRAYLRQAVALGVKEYYFTGGEPFLHPEMTAILEMTLTYGPATVLTNGTVLRDDWLSRLRRAEDASSYNLEFRVSLDGATAQENDSVRGAGVFDRILNGIRRLVDADFLPIVVLARTCDDQDEARLFADLTLLLKSIGYRRPRIKVLPTLRLGAETSRQRGYRDDERVTADMMEGFDAGNLLCHHSRIVTARGVMTCPILIEAPEMRLGDTLAQACRPIALSRPACYTCYQHGALCANAPARDVYA